MSKEAKNKMTKVQKVAVVLSQFKGISHKVLPHFSKDEQGEILSEIARSDNLPQKMVDDILNEFLDFYVNNAISLQGGIDVAKEILYSMYGPEVGEQMLAQLSASIQDSPLQILNKIDSEALINFVRGAHPQIIAALLGYLNDSKKQAAILGSIEKANQDKVLEGMAAMENGRMSAEMVEYLEEYVEKKFSSNLYAKDKNNKIGGLNAVVQVVNSLDMNTEKHIMGALEQKNPQLAEDIRKRMFVFDDFIKLIDRDIQLVLREVTNDDQLAMCLKYCNKDVRDELQDKFLRNMTNRKADIIKDSMDMIVRVKTKDLDEARQSITAIAKRLHEQGLISLGNSSEEYVD